MEASDRCAQDSASGVGALRIRRGGSGRGGFVRVKQRAENSQPAQKRSAEDSESRRSDGRTWSARGWLAVRAGFGCDSLRFSIERPSVFHWIFTTVSCREAQRQQLWRSSAGGQHSTPVVDQTGSRPPKRVLKSLFSFCSLHSEACRAREPEAHTHGNEHPHMTSRAQRGGRGEGARIPARPEGGVPLHCNRHFL